MKGIIVVLAVATLTIGVKYNGLRVHYGPSHDGVDKEYFFHIPRTISAAKSEGWKKTKRPPGPLPELSMYCPPGRAVCPLFDQSGFVAGLQLGLPADVYELKAFKPEKKYVKWNAPAMDGEPAKQYWTVTQFYIPPDSKKADLESRLENGETLQHGGVWVTGLDGKLFKIPVSEAELVATTAYKKQNCIPNMGDHYYYNMTKEMECKNILPWFVLTSNGRTHGTGYTMFGKLPTQKPREWYEVPPPNATIPELLNLLYTTIPHAPDCLAQWGLTNGLLAMHIYYIDDPWTIRCNKQ